MIRPRGQSPRAPPYLFDTEARPPSPPASRAPGDRNPGYDIFRACAHFRIQRRPRAGRRARWLLHSRRPAPGVDLTVQVKGRLRAGCWRVRLRWAMTPASWPLLDVADAASAPSSNGGELAVILTGRRAARFPPGSQSGTCVVGADNLKLVYPSTPGCLPSAPRSCHRALTRPADRLGSNEPILEQFEHWACGHATSRTASRSPTGATEPQAGRSGEQRPPGIVVRCERIAQHARGSQPRATTPSTSARTGPNDWARRHVLSSEGDRASVGVDDSVPARASASTEHRLRRIWIRAPSRSSQLRCPCHTRPEIREEPRAR